MIFSSISFLFYFLPIVLIIYYAAPKTTLKNIILLTASLSFYFCGEQWLIIAMMFAILNDYCCSLVIEKYRNHGRKLIPIIALLRSIIVNLGFLVYFKYSDFFIKNINSVFGTSAALLNIALPVGISFYTFQTMSYTIDVYMGNVKAERNLLNFSVYVTSFPQLVAGPIVRYSAVAPDLSKRIHTISDFSYGIKRFITGLAKKVLIADVMAELCVIFSKSNEKTVVFYWLSAIAFTFQIYFDFSGYSDMAIGLGRMFGFKFPENFNYPYISKTVTEFWRRWHISLGTWFRDYLYIPLGGNRVSALKLVRNIIVVWFLTGFWHGSEWTFIAWGLFYAFLLLAEKLFLNKLLNKVHSSIAHFYTILATILGFVMFSADDLSSGLKNIAGMFGVGSSSNGGIGVNIPLFGAESTYYLKSYSILFIIAIIASTPLTVKIINKIKKSPAGLRLINTLEPLVLIFLLLWSVACIIDGSYSPFIYYRF